MNHDGELVLDNIDALISQNTRLVALVHISNSIGTVNPVEEIIEKAHQQNIPVLLDAAQSVGHIPLDVKKLDCDYLAFSGHKMFGPTGIGGLYAKEKHLQEMNPLLFGGDMIKTVSFENTTWHDIPYKFEGGTPNIAGAIGLGAAVDYINSIGVDEMDKHSATLIRYACERLSEMEGLEIIGKVNDKSSIISFQYKSIHPHDIGTFLDQDSIAIRTGHHCTMPLMKFLGIPGTARISFSVYNSEQDVEFLITAIKKIGEIFK